MSNNGSRRGGLSPLALPRVSHETYCFGCGRLLVETKVCVVRAYEFDTLCRDVDVCAACEWLVKQKGSLEVQHEETMFVLRLCPHHY